MEEEIISSGSRRQKIIKSDEIFAFPNTMNDNNDKNDDDVHQETSDNDQQTSFEFKFDPHMMSNDSSLPGSPYKDSPADHLFRNGILLPHSFPVHQPMCAARRSVSYRRSASGASSAGSSKDSLISSRSNSTNSRSSCSSSARTSLSDSSPSDRKLFYRNNTIMRQYQQKSPVNRHQPVLDQVYGSSRRWQFVITPMPAMISGQEMMSSSRPKKPKHGPREECKKKIKSKKKQTGSSWLILRFFRYVLSVCRECHALEPSIRSEISQH